ncbi:Receptor-like serine/threonine-protein kinase [Citrus sinensis]|nr:cysteine-rich receptor-like protein kinase 6 [Citrus sinensis]KAH9660265.1 Receptor-like serine/threonine-protein kinase [Citrus sinensis]
MASIIISIILHTLLYSELHPANAKPWIRVGYLNLSEVSTISGINYDLFTHLICSSADINSTTYQLSLSLPSDENQIAKFADTVKKKNPSITMLLSIGEGRHTNYSIYSSMVRNSSHRKSFIDSSIRIARLYGFQGLDFAWTAPNTSTDMFNIGLLFDEWRIAATKLEAINSSRQQSPLILTARFRYSPPANSYLLNSMQRNLNWVHAVTANYYKPSSTNFTAPPAALHGSSSGGFAKSTDQVLKAWIERGLSADKLAMSLPFYGYAWRLVKPEDNGIGAAATGPALTNDGLVTYRTIKNHIKNYAPNVQVMYNSTYVVNYFSTGTVWFGFDDVEAVRAKIAYAKEKRLLGYYVWRVPFDDHNWVLSQAAAQKDRITSASAEKDEHSNKWRLSSALILTATAALTLLLGFCAYKYNRMKMFKLIEGTEDSAKASNTRANDEAEAGDFNRNVPNLRVYSLADIEAATEGFSVRNKLGEGGYGPVYKGVLPCGEVIAVKKLSKGSTQGLEEFKNEIMLTAKLQHVNLIRVLGFCIDSEERMLVYEYMPNKSLDCYFFDPVRRFILDWKKRVHIIEGITQGLLYLQEYSRRTIIHRDLKASNVLLGEDMKPKISDFGMARIFAKDSLEANTEQVVGTIGYIPPEYARQGVYSTKSDVFSFGVLLLQIISGKRLSMLCGINENLSILEHAYELWKGGKGVEFVDSSLDDRNSPCKLMRCLEIALLCVQENPNDRPSMLEVSSMLKNETTNINTPKKPAFSKQVDEIGIELLSTTKLEKCSAYDVSFLEVVAR